MFRHYIRQEMEQDPQIDIAKRARRRENSALFRANNKEKISNVNSVYYAKMKSNPEFMAKRNASILRSVQKRKLENLEENPKPIRAYIRKQILNPESLGISESTEN